MQDSDTADSCIYCRPVGKKQVNGKWVEQYVEGASIRMAEIVAACYGNIRVSARIIEQTDRFVKCEGVAHDLESNYAGKSEVLEATVDRDGKPYSERMRVVVAKATLSKAYRDAAFRVVPKALCKPIFEEAKRVANGTSKTLEDRRKKAQAWIASKRIDEARVFAALGVNGWTEVLDDHLTTLTGLKTAIGDGDVSIDEAFPPVVQKPDLGSKPDTGKGGKPAPGKPADSKAQKPSEKPPEAPTAPEKPPVAGSPEPAKAAEPATELPPPNNPPTDPAPTSEPPKPKARFVANPKETPELQAIRMLMHSSGVEEDKLMAFCRDNKLARQGQKLSDLSTAKLKDIADTWTTAVIPNLNA